MVFSAPKTFSAIRTCAKRIPGTLQRTAAAEYLETALARPLKRGPKSWQLSRRPKARLAEQPFWAGQTAHATTHEGAFCAFTVAGCLRTALVRHLHHSTAGAAVGSNLRDVGSLLAPQACFQAERIGIEACLARGTRRRADLTSKMPQRASCAVHHARLVCEAPARALQVWLGSTQTSVRLFINLVVELS